MYEVICKDAKDALKDLEDCSIDVLISDIPYGVNINTVWDKGLPSEDIWNECYRVLKPGSYCVIFGQPSMVMELMSVMSNTEFEYKDMWIWQYQGTHTKGFKLEEEDRLYRSRIRNVFNPIYVFRKKIEGTEKDNWLKYRTNLLDIDAAREPYEGDHTAIIKKFKETGEKHTQSDKKSNTFSNLGQKGWVPNEKGREPVNLKYFPRATKVERTMDGLVENTHETVKPINLMLWLVQLITNNEDQIILDPFCGSGSTGCACKLLNRKFIGVDIDEGYVNLAKERIANVNRIEEMLKKIRTPKSK